MRHQRDAEISWDLENKICIKALSLVSGDVSQVECPFYKMKTGGDCGNFPHNFVSKASNRLNLVASREGCKVGSLLVRGLYPIEGKFFALNTKVNTRGGML